MYPYNHKMGQKIQTDIDGVELDRAFVSHFQVLAADAIAADADGVLGEKNLTDEAQEIITGITDPAAPRGLGITGNVSGITGDVVIEGKNYADEIIDETIALNGTSTVLGTKAFKSVDSVSLPVQVHTPAAQTETKEVTAAVSSAGDVTLALTAAILGVASPKDVVVALTTDDDSVTKVADKIVDSINADADISEHFTASNEAGVITLTALIPLANDGTLSLAFTDTDTTGVTMGASTNGTAGVAYDKVSVGFSDILGLPYMLSHNTVLYAFLDNAKEATAPTVTLDADDIEGNTIDLNSALDGHVIDVYLLV